MSTATARPRTAPPCLRPSRSWRRPSAPLRVCSSSWSPSVGAPVLTTSAGTPSVHSASIKVTLSSDGSVWCGVFATSSPAPSAEDIMTQSYIQVKKEEETVLDIYGLLSETTYHMFCYAKSTSDTPMETSIESTHVEISTCMPFWLRTSFSCLRCSRLWLWCLRSFHWVLPVFFWIQGGRRKVYRRVLHGDLYRMHSTTTCHSFRLRSRARLISLPLRRRLLIWRLLRMQRLSSGHLYSSDVSTALSISNERVMCFDGMPKPTTLGCAIFSNALYPEEITDLHAMQLLYKQLHTPESPLFSVWSLSWVPSCRVILPRILILLWIFLMLLATFKPPPSRGVLLSSRRFWLLRTLLVSIRNKSLFLWPRRWVILIRLNMVMISLGTMYDLMVSCYLFRAFRILWWFRRIRQSPLRFPWIPTRWRMVCFWWLVFICRCECWLYPLYEWCVPGFLLSSSVLLQDQCYWCLLHFVFSMMLWEWWTRDGKTGFDLLLAYTTLPFFYPGLITGVVIIALVFAIIICCICSKRAQKNKATKAVCILCPLLVL